MNSVAEKIVCSWSYSQPFNMHLTFLSPVNCILSLWNKWSHSVQWLQKGFWSAIPKARRRQPQVLRWSRWRRWVNSCGEIFPSLS